jgi:hypothetical protein
MAAADRWVLKKKHSCACPFATVWLYMLGCCCWACAHGGDNRGMFKRCVGCAHAVVVVYVLKSWPRDMQCSLSVQLHYVGSWEMS